MLHGRRQWLRGAGSLAALAALPGWPRRAAAAGRVSVSPVTPAISLLTGTGGNVLVLATDAGQVLVDSGAAADAGDLIATLGELPGERVLALFNTHWHTDQVGANEAIGAAGATIYSHEKTRIRLTTGYYLHGEDRYQPALAAAGLPTESIFTVGETEIGGQQVRYEYLIEAHTDGDIFVYFPEHNVIAAGDAIAPVRDPVLDWFGGGWLGGRLDAQERLLQISNADTRFVPSYGPVVGRAEVEAERDLTAALFDRFVEHVRLGDTAEDMLAADAHEGLGREFEDPYKLLYDVHKGFWAHHNTLMHDIV